MSRGRSLRKKLFRKSTNQRWGKQNHVTAKSCSERGDHKKNTAATGRHHPFAKKESAHRGAFVSRTKRAVQSQAQSAEQQRTHGLTSVSGPMGSAAGSTTVLPHM